MNRLIAQLLYVSQWRIFNPPVVIVNFLTKTEIKFWFWLKTRFGMATFDVRKNKRTFKKQNYTIINYYKNYYYYE